MKRRARIAWLALPALPLACLALIALLPPLFGDVPAVGSSLVHQGLCVNDSDGAAEILVGGDSRAQYHVIPALLEEGTGRPAVNLAQWIHLGGDPMSLVNALKVHPEALARKPVVMVSVTLDVANDFAFKGIPLTAFLNWNLWDHARLAVHRPRAYPRFMAGTVLPSLARMVRQEEETGCGGGFHRPAHVVAEKGFRAYQGRKASGFWTMPAREEEYLLDGGNRRALRKALDWLDASPASRVILLHAPIDTAWMARFDGAVPLTMVHRFSGLLAAEARRHARVEVWDYVRDPLPGLVDSLFYDQYHLNRAGAELFSRHLAARLAAPPERPPADR